MLYHTSLPVASKVLIDLTWLVAALMLLASIPWRILI